MNSNHNDRVAELRILTLLEERFAALSMRNNLRIDREYYAVGVCVMNADMKGRSLGVPVSFLPLPRERLLALVEERAAELGVELQKLGVSS